MNDRMKVLITGGTGTIGNVLTDTFLKWGKEVCVFSRDEFKQSQMRLKYPNAKYILGDVRDIESLRTAFEEFKPDVVLHAAALKQITVGEENPEEVINTNINGTRNVLKCSYGTRCIIISSDKACYPINLYGATKMIAEKLAKKYSKKEGYDISVVRYGNVAGSRGSVIPVFRQLIKEGKTLTITSPEMTRFWITKSQAVNLIMNAITDHTFIHVPKLPSFRITDLIEAMGGGKADIVGVRPGEKLHETLLLKEENNGKEYSSDNNTEWLSIDNLKQLLTTIGED